MNLAVCNANTSHHTTHDHLEIKIRDGTIKRLDV